MIQRINAFLWGMREFRSSFTKHYVSWRLRNCYDAGRAWAHRLTFRRFEG